MADKLVKKRGSMKAKLTSFAAYLNVLKSCDNLSELQVIELETRLDKVEAMYTEFDELQTEIEVSSDKPDEAYATRGQFEQQYYMLLALARSLLSGPNGKLRRRNSAGSVAGSEATTAGGTKHNFVRLPKIDLPRFDGSYQCWLEFRDTFISLIHASPSIDSINKFHYLRASLKGQAAEVIKNIDFKADHYQLAWDLLCDRYNNSRLLVDKHLQALFDIEPVTTESSVALRNLVGVINKNIRALKSLDEPTQHWNSIIIHMMSSKLDSNTSRYWEEYRKTVSGALTLAQFTTFINNKAELLETLEDSNKHGNKANNNNNNKSKSFAIVSQNSTNKGNNNTNSSTEKKKFKCPMCSGDHFLYVCESFKKLTIEERNKKAKDLKVCMNCLRLGHNEKRCRITHCRYCAARHNTLLHMERTDTPPSQNPMPSTSESVALSANASANLQPYTRSCVLLSTALVKAVSTNGERCDARILLDSGSTANFITENLCGKLRLSRNGTGSTITGIGNQTSTSAQSCSLIIESNCGDYSVNIDCLILPEITHLLPSTPISLKQITIPVGIQLADPTFNIPSAVDILVGVDVFWSIISANQIKLGKNQPRLCESRLGWLVSGSVSSHSRTSHSHFCNLAKTKPITDLSKFWELDTVSEKHSLSSEERACEESFCKNTKRKDDGRFVVTIPFKSDPSALGDSYGIAKCRFLSLEKRFEREPKFKSMYLDFMSEYESLGHMTENDSSSKPAGDVKYFLPHHGVMRESSATTKLRTVFDASAKTTTGISLNDLQFVGPTVQDDLLSILLRFRQHKFVVSADIEKMYRAIEVNPIQRSLQQIIFRKNPTEPLKTYTLNTVTYGTASAPYLATKCLVSLADKASNPLVKHSIQHDFYVDDFLSGSDTISGALDLCKETRAIMASAKFNLRKWQSNSPEILKELGSSCNSSPVMLDLSDNNTPTKTLGVHWLCDSDKLGFSIHIESNSKITKRHILSVISQIFDPLGLVSPCIVEAKILMQRLWKDKCEWDDEVSQEVADSWLVFASTLPCLNYIKIPRWISCNNSITHEVHVFTDASERAYGACLYIRSVTSSGTVAVHLLTSKSRVAPVRPTTTPRLELCGALLGSRLCTKVRDSLTLPIHQFHYWCDSTIVLGWLSTPAQQLKPFVRNRVNEIQECSSGTKWRYVPSKDNPADLVSRGLKADLISGSALWWSGPRFLLSNKNAWPQQPNKSVKQDLPEVISNLVDSHKSSNSSSNLTCSLIIQQLTHKYSNFNYLQRVVAYILRFIHNLDSNNSKITGSLSADELRKALSLILRVAQSEMFPDEYAVLKSGKALSLKNRLTSLTPFLDCDNIIRVGGRLDNSPYEYDVKHPILLCSKHHLTKLLFLMQHQKLLHAGPQSLLSTIRQTYWPLGGRNLAKLTVNKCLKCFRFKAQNVQPIMGQLPNTRSTLEFPFINSSVDYAGPILISDRKGRGSRLIKSYLCIFVCMATKAVHLELVTDLSKEAYRAALNRFVARRGRPRTILSDNGTNFVGACNDLSKFLQGSDVAHEIAQEGIEFRFAPAYSPHFNGLAEAAVRSTKHHLKRLLQLTHFTYEEMATCLTQIEAILNSRPLTPLSTNPLDFSALTPSHFLIGRSLMSVPNPQITVANINRLERYQRVECIKQHFWKRFNLEYISNLQQKTRWPASTNGDIALGSLVLVKDKALPPLCWLLGRVVQVYPGSDGVTRVADLKTKRGTIRRGFNNICPLPL